MFMNMQQKNFVPHVPVLLNEVLTYLEPFDGYKDKLIIDCTFGAGGYSKAFLAQGARVVAIDRDPTVISRAELFTAEFGDRFQFINATFSKLAELDIEAPAAIVMDLGVSSMQIDQAERGFSFQKDGPLDMRMSSDGISAAEVVNFFTVADLTRIFRSFGEEKRAASIARMIEQKRSQKLFTTTGELSKAIETLFPRRYFEKTHPATRVFQALRIYVNNELGELTQALIASEKLLSTGSKLGVVSFHSLEDRIVKQFFAQRAIAPAVSRYLPQRGEFCPSFALITKSAIIAEEAETLHNPRARSAKLRVAQRTKAAAAIAQKEPLFNVPSLPVKIS